jgi:hypothetical protein
MVHYWLIHCHHQLGNIAEKEETINTLLVWVEKNPSPLHYRILSYVYKNLGEEENAETYMCIAFSLDSKQLNNEKETKPKSTEISDDKVYAMLNRCLLFSNPLAEVTLIQDRIMAFYTPNK